jgi:hypothetical protein
MNADSEPVVENPIPQFIGRQSDLLARFLYIQLLLRGNEQRH